MPKMIRQTQFNAGEVDIQVWKRTDVEEYLSAAQSLQNCEVGTTGLAKKRKGTEFMLNATAYTNPNSRMYEFVDKNDNHYLILSFNGFFYIFDAPTESAQVVTLLGHEVITIRNTLVVAYEERLSFVQSVACPYAMTDLDRLDYTQDNDSIVFTHSNYAPGRLYISSYGTNPPTFAFQYLDIYPLPAYDFNDVNYNNYSVSLNATALPPGQIYVVMTNPSGNSGFDTDVNSAWIGGAIIGGGRTETSPLGYGIITTVVTEGAVTTFTLLVQVNFEMTNFAVAGSQYSVRKPVWKTPVAFPTVNPITSGYPEKAAFYQSRLWFANVAPLPTMMFGSRINNPINFDVGVGNDTDAIIYAIGQNDSGEIVWINGGKQLEVFCKNYEFACPQDQNSALTPSTFSVRQQSSYGATEFLKPVTYVNDSYYGNKSGTAIINYHFNGVGLTYVASNISLQSSHLVKAPTNRALLRGSDQSQDNFIYFINPDDSTITAFQFANEGKLAALTPITFQDDVSLIDIVTIANEVYILKRYELTQVYTIERFNSAIKIDNARTASMDSAGVVTGLSDLNGYSVQVVYQEQDFGEYTVSGGQITVDNPLEIADTVFVGLLYDVDLLPMFPYAGQNASPFMKNVNVIYVDYYQSLDFRINGKLVQYQSFAAVQNDVPLTPQTGTAIIYPVSGWARFDNESLRITQSSPFDLQILSIGYQIESAVI